MEKVKAYASEPGVVIFSKSTCYLCCTVTFLFQQLGVATSVHEIDRDPDYREIEKALVKLGCSTTEPAVFIGGKLVGSTNEVMSRHLNGSLLPLVRPYQAQS
ncbi:hypothetical protein MLD38_031785 [Melastoma candidum]|uniref:Uncharacterized protein n=1 Tax=Melastoma candidum TaxID=119954 RepID=A0ACB9MQ48_9MYRT|nr:hypothetical protein MLD38_031785 [Melastoma candidum]